MTELLFEPLNSKDRQIAEVIGGTDDGTEIYLHTGPCCVKHGDKCNLKRQCCDDCFGEEEPEHHMREYILKGEGKMSPIPKIGSAQHGFIFGPTGSGKSVSCSAIARQYQSFHPDNCVFLISYIPPEKNGSIDKIPDLIRIPIMDILNGKVNVKTISHSMIIFDDVDAQPPAPEVEGEYDPKVVFKAVSDLRDQLLTTGRHFDINVLVTSHLGCDFKNTKKSLNESGFVVVYPTCGSWSHTERVLKVYAGLTREQIERIKRLPSRWVLVQKHAPQYLVYEKGVYLLH